MGVRRSKIKKAEVVWKPGEDIFLDPSRSSRHRHKTRNKNVALEKGAGGLHIF